MHACMHAYIHAHICIIIYIYIFVCVRVSICTFIIYWNIWISYIFVLSMHCQWPDGFSLAEDRLLPFSAGHEGEGFWVRRRSLGWRWEGCLMSPEMPPEIHFFMGMRGFQVGCNWDYEALLASSMARHPYHRTTPTGSGIWYGGGPKMLKF